MYPGAGGLARCGGCVNWLLAFVAGTAIGSLPGPVWARAVLAVVVGYLVQDVYERVGPGGSPAPSRDSGGLGPADASEHSQNSST